MQVSDSRTGENVSGLVVLFFAKNDEAVYIILDPQNRYFPRIVGSESSIALSSTALSSSESNITNAIVDKAENVCDEVVKFSLQGNLPEWWLDWKAKSESAFKELIDEKETVKLKDLDNSLKKAISTTASELAQKIGEDLFKITLNLGVTASKMVSGVGIISTATGICEPLNLLEWDLL